METLAHCILFEKTLTIGKNKLHMLMHKSNGDYNNSTSVYVNMLNPRCSEEDIIEEINLIFKD